MPGDSTPDRSGPFVNNAQSRCTISKSAWRMSREAGEVHARKMLVGRAMDVSCGTIHCCFLHIRRVGKSNQLLALRPASWAGCQMASVAGEGLLQHSVGQG